MAFETIGEGGFGPTVEKRDLGDILEGLRFTRLHALIAFATIFGFFIDSVDTSVLSLALPSLTSTWHLGGATSGFLGGSIFYGMMIGAATFGWLADLFGRKSVMILTLIGMCVFTAAEGLAPNPATFIVFRVLTGVFTGAMIPLDLAYLSEIAPRKSRGRLLGAVGVSWPLGSLVATLLAGWLLPTIGWRWTFGVMIIPALVGLLIWRYVIESPRWLAKRGRWDEAAKNANRLGASIRSVDDLALTEKRSADTRVRFTDGVRELFTPRYLVRAVGASLHYFLAYGLTYGWMVFLPTILLSVLGYPLQKTVFMVVLTNLASFLGRLTIAVTADKFQRYATLMVALVLYIAMSLVMSFAIGFGPGLVVLFVILMLVFQYANDLAAVFQQWIPEVFPSETRAFAASFTSAFGRLAAALFPILVGALVAGGGTKIVFYIIAGIGILLIINATVFLRRSETVGKGLSDVGGE